MVMPMLRLTELTAHSHPARAGWKIMSGIDGDRGVQRFSHAFSFSYLEAFQLEKIQTGCILFKPHNKPEREDVVLYSRL